MTTFEIASESTAIFAANEDTTTTGGAAIPVDGCLELTFVCYGSASAAVTVSLLESDEEAGTFELVMSFPVPYSSIVSNVAHTPESTNYVVNSGISHVFGEYDESGVLIRQFSYDCQLQGYRVFKESFEGFWFADDGKEDAVE